MKIVYCIAGTYNSGGMERVLTDKANWLCDHGYDITIVTTDQKGREPFFALNDNIPCFDLKINYADNNGSSFINKLLHYPIKQCKHKRSLSKLLEKLKADIVVCMFNNDASFIYTR
jgi:UDP-N-acetylglucosamine:LPS N-acetylglucosamine transferase